MNRYVFIKGNNNVVSDYYINIISELMEFGFGVVVVFSESIDYCIRDRLEEYGANVYVRLEKEAVFNAWLSAMSKYGCFSGEVEEILLLSSSLFGKINYDHIRNDDSTIKILMTNNNVFPSKEFGVYFSPQICKTDSFLSLKDISDSGKNPYKIVANYFDSQGYKIDYSIIDTAYNINDFSYYSFCNRTHAAEYIFNEIIDSFGEYKNTYRNYINGMLANSLTPLQMSRVFGHYYVIRDFGVITTEKYCAYLWVNSLEQIECCNEYFSKNGIKNYKYICSENLINEIDDERLVDNENLSLFSFFNKNSTHIQSYDYICVIDFRNNSDIEMHNCLDSMIYKNGYLADLFDILSNIKDVGVAQGTLIMNDVGFSKYLKSYYLNKTMFEEWTSRFGIDVKYQNELSNLNNSAYWIKCYDFPYELFSDEYLISCDDENLSDFEWRIFPYILQKHKKYVAVIDNYDIYRRDCWNRQDILNRLVLKTRNNDNKFSDSVTEYLKRISKVKRIVKTKKTVEYQIQPIPLGLKETIIVYIKKKISGLFH